VTIRRIDVDELDPHLLRHRRDDDGTRVYLARCRACRFIASAASVVAALQGRIEHFAARHGPLPRR
jgi:hypothetical protein